MEKLGDIRIIKEIGEGGMGAVFLGYQEHLDRFVAVKVLRESYNSNEVFVERFKREAKAIANLYGAEKPPASYFECKAKK